MVCECAHRRNKIQWSRQNGQAQEVWSAARCTMAPLTRAALHAVGRFSFSVQLADNLAPLCCTRGRCRGEGMDAKNKVT